MAAASAAAGPGASPAQLSYTLQAASFGGIHASDSLASSACQAGFFARPFWAGDVGRSKDWSLPSSDSASARPAASALPLLEEDEAVSESDVSDSLIARCGCETETGRTGQHVRYRRVREAS